MPLSAVVITKDEARNIRDCLESVSFCDEKIVVDSGSQDETVSIVRQMGASVFAHPFHNFASQKNFAISKASCEWVLLIDADERVSPELAVEIKETLREPQRDGFFLKRRNRIFGRWMKHGANKGDHQLRLVKRQKAVFQGIVHERIYLHGKTSKLKNPLLHYSTTSLSDYMNKCNIYTSMEAEIFGQKAKPFSLSRMKRRPFLFFVYRAFWQKGILDGLEGFFYCVLSAYYEFVKRAKHWELLKNKT